MHVDSARIGCLDRKRSVKIHRPTLAKLTNYWLLGVLIIAGIASVAWAGFLVWTVIHFIVMAL